MSNSLLVSPGTFRVVVRDAGRADLSQSERSPNDLALINDRCRILVETERTLREELAREQNRCKALRTSFEKAFEDFAGKLERTARLELTGLAVRLAEVIVRHELPDREMIRDVVQRTLGPLIDIRGTRVRLNPADAAALAQEGRNGHPLDAAGRFEIVPDPALAPGDVTMETPVGHFDARIAARLNLLETQLMERVAAADHEPRTANLQETLAGDTTGGMNAA